MTNPGAVLSFEQAVSAEMVTDVQISPDGRRIAYVITPASIDGERLNSDIWLAGVDDVTNSSSPRRLTTSEATDRSPRWSPDGRHIAFISDRRKRGAAQLYLLDVSGGEAIRLTDHEGGVQSVSWSPDGAMLAFTVRDGKTEDEQRRAEERDDRRIVDEDIKRVSLWRLTLARDDLGAPPEQLPDATRLSPEGKHVHGDASWSPDGSRLVVVLTPSPKLHDVYVHGEIVKFGLDGTEESLGGFEGIDSRPKYSPDGETIAFIAAEEKMPAFYALHTVPASGGPSSLVAPGAECSFLEFDWLPDGKRLLAAVVKGERQILQVIDRASGDLSDFYTPPDEPGVTQFISASVDGTRVAFMRASDYTYGDVHVADAGGTHRKLTNLNPWLREYDYGEVRDISWTSTDGTVIQGLLILPLGYREGERYPTLAQIHGGPCSAWTHRMNASWAFWGQFMAQRGYAVFMPNPRGSSGRGAAFAAAIAGCYGEPDSEDILSGVDYLVEQGIADPDRLVVGGSSGGGYLTNWIITRTDRFKAAVTGAGISNWVSMQGTSDARGFLESYVGSASGDVEAPWRLSPIRYVSNVTTPTLIRYGADDTRVPPSQGHELYEGLKSRGVETELVLYPREVHGAMTERKHQIDLLQRVTAWFDRHVGKEPLSSAPVHDEVEASTVAGGQGKGG